MFRKLSEEQSGAVAIFLVWIIAGLAFNILWPGLMAGFWPGSKWLAWIPIGLALAISLIIVTRSKVGIHMMFMVLNGLVGGVFGTRGVIDLAAVALRFSWKFLVLGISGLFLAIACTLLMREFLALIPDFLTHRRQMAEMDARIASWREPEPSPAVEPKPMLREAELAALVAIEYRLLNPPEVEELVFADEFPLTKLLIQAFALTFAMRIALGNQPLKERLLAAAAFLVLIPFGELIYRRAKKRAASYEPPADTEFDEIRERFLLDIRARRRELLCSTE
jgi:hypothetical protein